jgi:hypothetical protein
MAAARATVETGKWGPRPSGTPMVTVMLSEARGVRMVLGATDRNCRLLP